MLSFVRSRGFFARAGFAGLLIALTFQVTNLFSEVYIVYNGILVLMLMGLVVGIGQHRRQQLGTTVEHRRLPMYWPMLLILTLVFLDTADSMATFQVVKIAIS